MVRPRTEAALKTIMRMVEHPYGDGKTIAPRIPRFHFYWSPDHFRHEPDMFRHNYIGLSEQNKTIYTRIIEFVRSVSPSRVKDEAGKFVLDSRGNQVTVLRVIDTRSMVLSDDPMELLGRNSSFISLLISSLSFLLMNCFCFLCAVKMSQICSLVNKSNQKITGQSSSSRRRENHGEWAADVWFSSRGRYDPS